MTVTSPLYVHDGQASGGLTVETVSGSITVEAGGQITNTLATNNGSIDLQGDEEAHGEGSLSTVVDGGGETVEEYGLSIQTTVNDDGFQDVGGGTSISATINDDGFQYVGGGTSISATINDGGSQYVTNEGESWNTTINAGGSQYVYSNGVASATLITNEGEVAVESGGTTYATNVGDGGAAGVASGGTTYNTVISSGGTEGVFTGGIEAGGTVLAGGTMLLLGGSEPNLVVSSGGSMVIENLTVGQFSASNVVQSGLTVPTGASLTVDSGGSAIGVQLASQATVYVNADGLIAHATAGNGAEVQIESSGYAVDTVVDSGGTETIFSGGIEALDNNNGAIPEGGSAVVAGLVIVGSGGSMYVEVGGTGWGIDVHASGTVIVSGTVSGVRDEGGTATGQFGQVLVRPGGSSISGFLNGGLETVLSGGYSSATSVGYLGVEYVGGSAVSVGVGSGGFENVASGGVAENTVVSQGGSETIYSGGSESLNVANGVVPEGGGSVVPGTVIVGGGGSMAIFSGGTGYGIDVHSGGAIDVAGTVSGLAVEDGGSAFIQPGGSAMGSFVNGYGEFVQAGGSSVSATVSATGEEYVYGIDSDTHVLNGGYQFVESGGSAFNTVVDFGGSETISGGGEEFLSAGNTVNGTTQAGTVTVLSGGSMLIASGGTGYGIVVQSGGSAAIAGFVSGLLLESGGSDTVRSGGSALNTSNTAANSGSEIVNPGGLAISADVDGGLEIIDGIGREIDVSNRGYLGVVSGGSTVDTTVDSGGLDDVDGGGSDFLTTVNSGGTATIDPGGYAQGMTIGGGGGAYLSAGGTMLSPTIQDSGTLTALGTITGVATDNGLIYVPAGVLTLNGLAGTGELTIANGANVAMKGNANLANLVVNAGGTLQVHGVTVDTDPLTIDAGGTIIGDGVIGGSITDDGFITVSGGVLQFTGAINGPGTITIDGGATLLLDGAVNSGVTIDFNSDGSGTLEEADPSGMQGTIMGEQPGDVVENATCYLAGTRISTSDGDRAIETLMAGDLVQAHFAGMTPVQWIGYRRIDCHRHPNPRKVWPVRVAAGAFGEQSPRRDLCLSPDHAVFVDGVLIPIKHLINGTTIEQVPMDTITYYHLELSEHDVLLADGLPAESYLDTGDRSKFANGGSVIMLHPDFSTYAWEAMGCAPLVVYGPVLNAVRRRSRARAHLINANAGTVNRPRLRP